jgi:hypothetical protein
MASEASVFQMGGGGFVYENYIQSAFLTAMILKGNVPTFQNGSIDEIAFQCKRKGYETDDLFLKIKNEQNEHRVVIQIKYNISLTEKSKIFKDVIKSFWIDFNKSEIFNIEKDKFFLIKSSLTNDDKNQIIVLLDWAKTHKDEIDFYSEIERIDIKKQNISKFSSLLKEANDGVDVSKKQVWEFLKCFNLLAYDFTIQSSTHQANILDLLKLSKTSNSNTSPIEIWNTILAKCAELNINGGSVTYEDLKSYDLYKYFDLSYTQSAYNSLQKLVDDGNLILKPFKSTIRNYHINRDSTRLKIKKSFNDYSITFITGNPGVGKSAIVKELLENEFIDSIPIIFKADQFNKSNLAQVFGDVQISHNIQELFSTMSLLQNKVIIIDSAEKLLEGDPDNAFKQLLTIINETTGLKLLITSRSYAVNIITQKYGVDSEKLNLIEIPNLSDLELDNIVKEFPQLNNLFLNKEIKEILRSPKYLEYGLLTISQENFKTTKISLKEFKEKLWSQIIENATVVKNGLSRKREKAFNHIAISRALSMQLFFEPNEDFNDFETIEVLLNDNVISRNGIKYEFAPSHDILEDWALIRYIESIQKKLLQGESLFEKLSNQPAIRRAFRLWIEDLIINNPEEVIQLINDTLNNKSIETYWTDEVLTAVFRTENCEIFFSEFKEILLQNNAVFLNRCILIARTTCREYSFDNNNSKDILFPIGSIWQELLNFIAVHLEEISIIRNSVIQLLFDWEYKILFQQAKCSSKEIAAGICIVSSFIKEIESNDEYWYKSFGKENWKELIYLFFYFLPHNKTEIENLLIRSYTRKKDDEFWELNDFYKKVIAITLGAIRNQKVIANFPDLVIKIANKKWKKSLETKKESKNKSQFNFPIQKERDDCWGLKKDYLYFFPPGIYKTFTYTLLVFEPIKAINFIIDFTNYITKSYADSEFSQKDNLEKIDITLNDGLKIEQYGNSFLWSAYRGITVTNHLFESVLMSLEKYLLELAISDIEDDKKLFQNIIEYCLKNSNSVSISSVIVSVFIAHPKSFGETILPILKTRRFYEFDVERSTREHSSLEIVDQRISFAQKERYDSNQLPHRRKYPRGLREFIFYYQFYERELNNELHKIFDGFYKNVNNDVFWEKAISEMDIRKYKSTILDNEKGIIQLEVSYSKDVQEVVQEFTELRKDEDSSLIFSGILHNAIEKDELITFEQWEAIYKHFSSIEIEKSMFDKPVSLSVLGLQHFLAELDTSQKKWCLETISNTTIEIIKNKFSRDYGNLPNYNILEASLTIKSIHLLFDNILEKEPLYEIKVILSYLLICPLAEYEEKEFYEYFRTTFNNLYSNEILQQWYFLVDYSKFITQRPNVYNNDQALEEDFKQKEHQFILNWINNSDNLNFDDLSFDLYKPHNLGLALLLIPVNTKNELQKAFILKITELILDDFKHKNDNDYTFSSSRKKRKLDSTISIKIQFYINEVLLYNDLEFSKKLLETLINPFLDVDFEISRNTVDVYKFVYEIFDYTITRLDDVVVLDNESDINKYAIQFWELWKCLFERFSLTDKNYFQKQLLLDTKWSLKSDNWKGFINKKSFYEEMIKSFGNTNFEVLLNVFSTFGEKVFLPNGLTWIAKFLKENPENLLLLNSKSSKKFIQVLFNNHIAIIKNHQNLVSDFIFILNKMVEIGSSEAYLIRESVITYKKIDF